jgi:glycosyltransferase involved in cell wall biosynthesis
MIDAVITSYNQKEMILQAVHSLLKQFVLPSQIIIVDDGSTDPESLSILKQIESNTENKIPVRIQYQDNQGVSAARNTGIHMTSAPFVLVLDGDDTLEPSYIESVMELLQDDPKVIAASSWIQTFGAMNVLVRPDGGDLISFLSHNCCPAAHILRRNVFDRFNGYDESMRTGFEDWEYFISMLETEPDAYIGMVERPLINYRTAPASANIASMDQRMELMRYIMEKHKNTYRQYAVDALLGIEYIAEERLLGWEMEMDYVLSEKNDLSESSKRFLTNPSYGDGGMASAVRIHSKYEIDHHQKK